MAVPTTSFGPKLTDLATSMPRHSTDAPAAGIVPPMEDRITELEIRFTHQQDTIDQLSELVRTQQDAIDRLSKAVKMLEGRLKGEGEEIRGNEPPPHY